MSILMNQWNEFFHSRYTFQTTATALVSSLQKQRQEQNDDDDDDVATAVISNGNHPPNGSSSSSSSSHTSTARRQQQQQKQQGNNSKTKSNTSSKWVINWIHVLRIIYAYCILYDRIILTFDFQKFFCYTPIINSDVSSSSSSTTTTMNWIGPLIPCQQYSRNVALTMTYNFVDMVAPYSPYCSMMDTFMTSNHIVVSSPEYYYNLFFWSVHIISIVNGILLLFNIYPKIQLLLLHLNMMSFHYHSFLIWDGEDVMFKVWNFLFLFLPLRQQEGSKRDHAKTTTTTTKGQEEGEAASSLSSTSYPMWPIRLFQIELCCIYLGAGYAKLSTDTWRSGNALYHVIHEKDFFGGPYVPEFIFHRYGPLKLATWSSLFLECTCMILIWSSNPYIKYGTLLSMIALHIGIELTMNMHVFEILSIIGWCMFFITPSISYQEYKKVTTASTNTTTSSDTIFTPRLRHILLNLFLVSLVSIFIIDTFPLNEINYILNDPIYPYVASWSPSIISSTIATSIIAIQSTLNQLRDIRRSYISRPILQKYFYPFGLYQDVWTLYSGAPDISCIFTTNISTYTTDSISNGSSREHYSYSSPDWGKMSWYTKKRYQRPMTMQEKLQGYMCRDCYVRYHAHQMIQEIDPMNVRQLQLASATLTVQCEHPPLAPETDDWFNWTGWFYANAKQDILIQQVPSKLYVTNICDDLNIELCTEWYNFGWCTTADRNHQYRHYTNQDGSIQIDHDAFVYNMTQTCRKTCQLCPEHGYDADALVNGTRITTFWPVPTWDDDQQMYHYVPEAMYYDGTIIQVKEYPLRQYLIRYDDPIYNDEWYDPMIVRDRGFRFIPSKVDDDNNSNNDSNGDVETNNENAMEPIEPEPAVIDLQNANVPQPRQIDDEIDYGDDDTYEDEENEEDENVDEYHDEL